MSGIAVPQGFRSMGRSERDPDGSAFTLVRDRRSRTLLFVAGVAAGFDGESFTRGKVCPLTLENARALAVRFPWLRPCRLPEDSPSFGFGDRLGLATPGHIRAVGDREIFPILAQQSVRENARTGRAFGQVLADAVFAAFREGFDRGFGADADHLKRIDDAIEAARLGYSFFTCDPGDVVQPADSMSVDELRARFAELPGSDDLRERYAGRSHRIEDAFVLRFSEEELLRAAVKYFGAVEHAVRMYRALVDEIGPGFDYEVSVDETDSPTSPLEHLFVALELRHRGVDFVSLAPRFRGAMEKGVDWRGDLDAFKRDLAQHAAVARTAGGHRLSLHSGSDKFSIYPLIAEATGGRCHVKTAGTSYLVAVEVIARCEPDLFRSIAARSLDVFAEEQATYHISADPRRIPAIDSIPDAGLPELVETHDSRQVLHVAYGSILHGPLAEDLFRVLGEHEEAHYEALARHLGRHLDGLGVGRNG